MNNPHTIAKLRLRAGLALAGMPEMPEDNERLSEQVQRLTEDNKALSALVQAAASQEERVFEHVLAMRVTELTEERDNLLDVIQGNVKDVMVSRMSFENGVMDMYMRHPLFGLFMIGIAGMLTETNAPNYLESRMLIKDHGGVVVTIQKENGKTPHEMRQAAEAERDALRIELDVLRDLHREICVALEQRGYQAFANEDIGKLIDQITHDHKIQFSRAEQAETDNFRLRELIRDAVDCWFNHDKRGDYAEVKAMHALRGVIEKEKESES